MGKITTPADLWRLAEEAERRHIRILVEPISGEHFATSATNPTVLYRLTHLSCSCKGFMTWQRCTHHSLLLAHLGWLPDDEPEPDPTPVAVAPPPQVVCPECHGTGTEMAMGRSGRWFQVDCVLCQGSGQVDAGDDGSSDDPSAHPDRRLTAPPPATPSPLAPRTPRFTSSTRHVMRTVLG